jgi:uncharacterized repeat protein (TIGR01451 family)/CSLREA domain-containing protein
VTHRTSSRAVAISLLFLSVGPLGPRLAAAATFVVDDTADAVDASPGDGVCETAGTSCTLRAAVQEANALTGADLIQLPAGTFTLSLTGDDAAAATGDLDLLSEVTIDGAGIGTTIVDASGVERAFDLVCSSCTPFKATLQEIEVLAGTSGVGKGLRLGPTTDADVVDSQITAGSNAAIALVNGPSALLLDGSTVESGGRALTLANILGAIEVILQESAVTLTAPGARAFENTTCGSGATTFSITDSTVASSSTGGSGFFLSSACVYDLSVTVEGSAFTNLDDSLTGLFCQTGASCSLEVTDSEIVGSGSSGAGLALSGDTSHTASISSSLFEDSGLTFNGVTATLENTTISGAFDGVTSGSGADVTLDHVTISDSTHRAAVGAMTVSRSILANSTLDDCLGTLTSGGHNLIENATSCTIAGDTTGNVLGVDPLLAPLADNGGTTRTHALTAGSAGVDGGPAICLATSQNGVARPQDGNGDTTALCDIGAFEAGTGSLPNSADLSITKDDGLTDVTPGQSVTYTIGVANAGPTPVVAAQVSDVLPTHLTSCSWTCSPSGGGACAAGPVNGDISDTVDLPPGATLTYTLDCTVSTAATGNLVNTATVAAPPWVNDTAAGNDSATDSDAVEGMDFGDAPDPTYPTLGASDGARHLLSSLFLGASIDADLDGQPNATASGDDSDGTDDEDGVVLPAEIEIGSSASIDVTVTGGSGWLYIWGDWNLDGDWGDSGEAIDAEFVNPGSNSLSLTVPGTATAGTTYVRFRLVSTFLSGPTGMASNGEVEDYAVDLVGPRDYGDAPDPFYPTLSASDGAAHTVVAGFYLGSSVDADPDGQPSAAADGDDTDEGDDDDGVAFTAPVEAGTTASLEVTASQAGVLNAWIDYNGDHDWEDSGEQIFTDEALGAGLNALEIEVPYAIPAGPTFARFRFDSTGGLGPDGAADDGEVEDYEVELVSDGPYVLLKELPVSPSAGVDLDNTFGARLARSGDTLVVSARAADVSPSLNRGVAYVFERDEGGEGNWGQVKELVGTNQHQFGWGVALDGDTLAIGEHLLNGEGVVHVFERDEGGAGNWGEIATLSPSTIGDGAFGISVALDGDTLAVGAEGAFGAGAEGVVYVFGRDVGGADNWGEVRRIVPSDSAASDLFGRGVGLDGNWIAVAGGPTGLYFFERNEGGADNWGEKKAISSAARLLSLDGDRALAGSFGSAALYERNEGGTDNWGVVATPSPAESLTGYGRGVHTSGGFVGVSATGGSSNPLRAALFRSDKNGPGRWGELQILEPAATATGLEGIEGGIHVSSDLVVVGDPSRDTVFLFARATAPAEPDPPSADAGIDRTIAVDHQPAVLGGAPAASGGAPPYTVLWEVAPGTAGVDYTLDSASEENPIFTGHTEGIYTATLTVTDDNTLQAMDDAEITVQVPSEWDLFDEELSGTAVFSSCQMLTAEEITLLDGADVELRAPLVILLEGFSVASGAQLAVSNDPPSSCP